MLPGSVTPARRVAPSSCRATLKPIASDGTELDPAKHKAWGRLGAIVLVGLCLRLPNFTESLWFDELWATRIKLGTFNQLVREMVIDVHPPLYYMFSYFWIKLFGDSEIAIRLPPLLFGLAGIVMTFVYGSRVAGRWTGLLAAALVAFSPVHIWYSQEARPYTALMVLVLMAAYAGNRAAEAERPFIWPCIYAAAMLMMLFTHFYMVAYLVPTALVSFCMAKRKRAGNRIVQINVAVFGMLALFIGIKAYLFGMATGDTVYLRDFSLFELLNVQSICALSLHINFMPSIQLHGR